MPTIQETAYPRLKTTISPADLAAIYTPSPEEKTLAKRVTRGKVAYLGFLVLLKTFQRLGYGELVGLPVDSAAMVKHLQPQLRPEFWK